MRFTLILNGMTIHVENDEIIEESEIREYIFDNFIKNFLGMDEDTGRKKIGAVIMPDGSTEEISFYPIVKYESK